MNPHKVSSFNSVEMSDADCRAAYTFTSLQLAGIQNQISEVAEEILRQPLDLDDTSIPAIKKRAYLQGQLVALQHLKALHFTYNSQQEAE